MPCAAVRPTPSAASPADGYAYAELARPASVAASPLAEECALALSYNGLSQAVMMVTPQDLEDFVRGFTLSSGLIDSLDEIYDLQLHGDGAWMLDLADGKMQKVLDDPTAEEFAWSPDGTRVAFHSRRDRQWGIWVLTR